jgi:Scavenger mRNA decapping enzyme (DcpS) N-terminal
MDSQRNEQRDAPSKVSAEDDRSSKRLKVEDPGETSKDPKVPEEPSTSVGKPIDDHKILPVVDRSIFENFAFKKVLKADPSRKIAFIHGTFQNEKDAVVILEQSAFDLDRLNELFASEASAELEFQNDAYHNYRIFFPKEFNGEELEVLPRSKDVSIDSLID